MGDGCGLVLATPQLQPGLSLGAGKLSWKGISGLFTFTLSGSLDPGTFEPVTLYFTGEKKHRMHLGVKIKPNILLVHRHTWIVDTANPTSELGALVRVRVSEYNVQNPILRRVSFLSSGTLFCSTKTMKNPSLIPV